MKTTNQIFLPFFILLVLLSGFVASAQASRLYEINELREDSSFEIDPHWFSNEVIEDAKANMKKDPTNQGLFLFQIASTKAQQGKPFEALQDMANIQDEKVKQSADFLEERAEIKSMLGFDSSAIEDMERIQSKDQNWKMLWHKSLILKRAGKIDAATHELRKAVAEAERFRNGDNFHRILLQSAKKQSVAALEPDAAKAEQSISLMRSLLSLGSAPNITGAISLLGLAEKSAENQTLNKTISYAPASPRSPLKSATLLRPDAHQITLVFDSAACGITEELIRKQFDAATLNEIEPGGMGGCGPGTLTLFSRSKDIGLGQFTFDGGEKPYLRSFYIVYKGKPSG
jgi:hypothetical protein